MNSIRSLVAAAFCSASMLASAQQISITSGSAVSCSGVIEDSGGPSGPYSDGENITFTICPDVPGNVVYLTWFVFNLSTVGPQADNLTIYDGDNTSAVTLGTYTGSALQNLVVSGTVFNTSGCLTLVFHSNSSGTGEFACGFQCTIPCQNPLAIATMTEAVPALICQNEVVNFDGSASFAQAGYNIAQYMWDFDDGSVDSTSGALVSHAFPEDGEHVVQLTIIDDNDCGSLNRVDLQILVSTTPHFILTDPSMETCFGETVTFFGHADPVTWTGIPDANFGDGVFLPDDVGLPFTSTLGFEQFASGQVVTNMSNIQQICVEMEHTFMGDLVLQVICPNGQSVILHQQGGGGTYIGAANDNDSNEDPVVGECWQYCWDPNATNGTWIENLANVTTAGTPPNNALNPGTYESVQPMSNLIGCPLNGEWVYQSTDLWGADNGFICSWSIDFDPAIIPDVTTFTPSIGPEADSSLWTGGTTPDLISANGDTITFTAPDPGAYPFEYQVTDDFGCTYDTTIVLTVDEPFLVDAGEDIVICNDPLQLNAGVVGGTANCVWTLEMNDWGWDGWNGASLTVNINGVPTDYSADFNQTIVNIPVQSGDAISLTYTAGDWEDQVTYILTDDQGTTIFEDGPNPATGAVWSGIGTCGGAPPMVWSWSPTEGLSNPDIANPTVLVTSETEYVVTGYIFGHPICSATDTVVVTLDPGLDPGNDSLVVVCATPPTFELIDMLGGNPAPGGVWTDVDGNVVPNTLFDPQVEAAGVFTYTLTTPLGCVGTADLTIEILPASDPSCCGIVDAGPDSTICTLTYGLSASIGNTGTGVWTGPAGYSFADASSAQTDVTATASGPAMFYWTEDDGVLCYLVDSVTITFTQPLAATVTKTDAICFEVCDGTADVAMTGGIGDFTYVWSDNIAADTSSAMAICDGTYSVTVTDENGCTTTADLTISQPVLLEVDGTSFIEPWCHGSCDGSVSISDAEAVEYSFDGGASFSPTPTLDNVCTGVFEIMIHNAAGCEGTGLILLPEPPEVIAEFTHGPIPANVDAPRIFFTDQSLNSVTRVWDIAGLMSSTDATPVYTFSNKIPDTYEVCLVASDAHECTDTICHDVIIDDVLFTYVPNAFTPDGDGENEQWWMTSNIPDMKGFELRVFDRWGQLVFEANDPYKAWNGTFQNSGGEILKQDVYAYRIVYQIASTGGVREELGHVTLLK